MAHLNMECVIWYHSYRRSYFLNPVFGIEHTTIKIEKGRGKERSLFLFLKKIRIV